MTLKRLWLIIEFRNRVARMPRGASFGNAFDAAYMADSLVKAAFLACGEVEDDWGEAIQSVLIVARDKLKEALAILGGDLPQPEETANGA